MKTTQITIQLIQVLLTVVLFSSCYGLKQYNFYAPDRGTALVLTESQDLKISAGTGFVVREQRDKILGNMQVAYSPVNHLGIQASHFSNTYLANYKNTDSSSKTLSFAIGGYRTITKRKDFMQDSKVYKASKLILDLYLGYSSGELNESDRELDFLDLNFNKKYFQFGIASEGNRTDFRFSTKFSRLNYTKARIGTKVLGENPAEAIDDLLTVGSFPIMENNIEINFGMPDLRFYLSFTGIEALNYNRHFLEQGNTFYSFEVGLKAKLNSLFYPNKKIEMLGEDF